jgi:hypothetical protein
MMGIAGPAQFLLVDPDGLDSIQVGRRPHYRRIPRSYSISSTETTVGQYRRFLEANPWVPRQHPAAADAEPVTPQTFVTWYEAAAYCNWLSQTEGLPEEQWCYVRNDRGEYAAGMRLADDYLDRRGYRLPTEAEWEYACRAGANTAFCFGADPAYLDYYAVYGAKSEGRAWPVGSKKPNDLGLFDMHGNAGEWCQDLLTAHAVEEDYASIPHADPASPVRDGDHRVVRGGTFLDRAGQLHCAARGGRAPEGRDPACGFRVARGYP